MWYLLLDQGYFIKLLAPFLYVNRIDMLQLIDNNVER